MNVLFFFQNLNSLGPLSVTINRLLSLRSFMANAKEAGFKNEDETIQHILLFVSALIPKALASLLTSFCIAMSGPDKVSSITVGN